MSLFCDENYFNKIVFVNSMKVEIFIKSAIVYRLMIRYNNYNYINVQAFLKIQPNSC
jgi:hypothetical protein